jgi:hypothetical protein
MGVGFVAIGEEGSASCRRAIQGCAYPKLNKRDLRRREVKHLVMRLERVLEAEEAYRDNIPENLQGSARYDDACETAETLDECISLLSGIY